MKLVCVGNALLDFIANVSVDFAPSKGMHQGSCAHVDQAHIEGLVASLDEFAAGAGGGAANVARAYVALGGRASFTGAVGLDAWGAMYEEDLAESGVEARLAKRSGCTGVFCALKAPGGQRSLAVYPGVAPSLTIADIPESFFSAGNLLYLDGFLALHDGELLDTLIYRAKKAGMPIAFDAGGQRLVESQRELFSRIIKEDAAYSFLNEDEFMALAHGSVDEVLASFSSEVGGVLVVKRAEAGAVCIADGQLFESTVRTIEALDETGAGDAFAAGFLTAARAGSPMARCLRMGNWTAEHAIQVPGMALDALRLRRAVSAFI